LRWRLSLAAHVMDGRAIVSIAHPCPSVGHEGVDRGGHRDDEHDDERPARRTERRLSVEHGIGGALLGGRRLRLGSALLLRARGARRTLRGGAFGARLACGALVVTARPRFGLPFLLGLFLLLGPGRLSPLPSSLPLACSGLGLRLG